MRPRRARQARMRALRVGQANMRTRRAGKAVGSKHVPCAPRQPARTHENAMAQP
jgi:hypothetical protein